MKENNDGTKKVSGNTVFEKYGGTITTQAFAYHYDSTVDSIYANVHGIDIGIVPEYDINIASTAGNRFLNLYFAKADFYDSQTKLVDSETRISGNYQDYIYNDDGTVNTNYYKNYNNKHYGIDLGKPSASATSIEGSNILAGLSGKIVLNYNDTNSGNSVHMQYGYNFEKTFIETGIYGEYDHLKNLSTAGNGYLNRNAVIGTVGNTGDHSLGAHLHYTMYTNNSTSFSDTTLKILLGKNYMNTSMYNGYGKTVYDPTAFYNRNRSKK